MRYRGERAQSQLDSHDGLFPPWPLAGGNIPISFCLLWAEQQKAQSALPRLQDKAVPSGRVFFKNSLK